MIDGAQLHLLFNHLPILGIPFSLLLLGLGLWKKSPELQKVSMGVLVLAGLLAIPAFTSGEAAEEIVEDLPGISESVIENHEEFAEIAFWFLEGLALVTLGGMIYFRKQQKMPAWFTALLLVGMLVGGGLMVRTGHLGGMINHPELRSNTSSQPVYDADDEHDEH